MNKLKYRRVHQKGTFAITEIEYDELDVPVKYLNPECGILSYWLTPQELRKSCMKILWAFLFPIIDLDNFPNKYKKKN